MRRSFTTSRVRALGAHALPCERALALLPRLWNGEIELDEQRHLRAHVLECAPCKSEYVRSSSLTSAIARDGRVGRLEAVRVARRKWLKSLARAGAAPRPRLWVRTLVVPAILIAMLSRPTPPAILARVEAQSGEYSLGERRLAREHKPQRVARGDLVVANDGARVRLFDPQAELIVAGPGSLVVEAPAERRYLLGAGSFEVSGPHLLTTPWGLIELSTGQLALEIESSGARVELRTGSADLVRASGVCALPEGEPMELGAGL